MVCYVIIWALDGYATRTWEELTRLRRLQKSSKVRTAAVRLQRAWRRKLIKRKMVQQDETPGRLDRVPRWHTSSLSDIAERLTQRPAWLRARMATMPTALPLARWPRSGEGEASLELGAVSTVEASARQEAATAAGNDAPQSQHQTSITFFQAGHAHAQSLEQRQHELRRIHIWLKMVKYFLHSLSFINWVLAGIALVGYFVGVVAVAFFAQGNLDPKCNDPWAHL